MPMTLAEYQALPYTRRMEGVKEPDGTFYWLAWIEELPGCKADGATQAEAMTALNEAFDECIKGMLEFETEIPLPERESLEVGPAHREQNSRTAYLPTETTKRSIKTEALFPGEEVAAQTEGNTEENIHRKWRPQAVPA